MKFGQPIRPAKVRSRRLRCAFCGSTDQVERHHLGGRFHVAWCTMPLCLKHHARLTAALRLGTVDMRYTSDKRERLRRARQAAMMFLWMLGEMEKE
jgi:hypothetical protein